MKKMMLLAVICVVVAACKSKHERAIVFYKRGVVKDSLKDYNGAIAELDTAIMLDSIYAEAYYNRGLSRIKQINQNCLYEDLKKLNMAIMPDFDKAIEIDPAYGDAYYQRALIISDYGDDRWQALPDYGKALAINKRADIYLKRANVKLLFLNDRQGAKADCDTAIAMDPKNIAAYWERSRAEDEWSEIADYDKIIKLSPGNRYVYSVRALTKNDLKDYQGAIKDFDTSLMLGMGIEENCDYYFRGFAKYKTGDFRGAVADCDTAIAINRIDDRPFLLKGDAKYALHDYKAAIAAYEIGVSGPEGLHIDEDPDAYYNMGIAKIKSGRKRSGCADLATAVFDGNKKAAAAIREYCK